MLRFRSFTILVFIALPHLAISQQDVADSVLLPEIRVRAFEQNKILLETPAAVVSVSRNDLNRFSNSSILPALNNNPGIRMEERSPGSYRMNIRGSTLRSPFGVRNVKTYYNDIPYTDPGGNTYLNQLGFFNFRSLEIIKGPGNSLYGAGTGGVILIRTNETEWHSGLNFDVSAGNYGMLNLNSSLRLGTEDFQNTFHFTQISSTGYRDHTELDRKVFTWDTDAKLSDKGIVSTHFIWGDLYYQTPGGLTLSEFSANPQAARPRVGQTPGAVENKAAIYQELFLAGIRFNQKFSEQWENTTSFYGAATRVRNPSIRNYERRNEPHSGGRSFFQYKGKSGIAGSISLISGIEFQQGLSTVKVYANKNGNPDTLQTDDEVNNRLFSAFTQFSYESKKGWHLTGGLSLNNQQVSVTRFSIFPVSENKRKYSNQLAPRFAVLKKLNMDHSVFAILSRGYSPPTTAEILPSTGQISTQLEAENGTNYEAGFRGRLLRKKLIYNISLFHFTLNNTIVQRRDQSGADFFINAGSTRQTGIESQISYVPLSKPDELHLKFWLSHTWHRFRYKDFKQLNTDFSGNRLPGVAPHVVAAGFDLVTKPGIYLNGNYYFSDAIPLNDANTATASSFHLFSARAGWKKNLHPQAGMELFIAAENIFNCRYSLGNDINAFGGRFFNTAPGFSFSGGISLNFMFR